MFEICAHGQFETNLKEIFNRVNTPISRNKKTPVKQKMNKEIRLDNLLKVESSYSMVT